MQSHTDEQLMEIYQNNKDGDGAVALNHLYHRYAKPMLNFFYFTLHNDHNKAQDFVQDLFVKIIENHQRFDTSQPFKAWVYRIASNMCKNEFRNNKVIQKYKDHVASSGEFIDGNNESEETLRISINKLSQEHRSLIVLKFKLKMTAKEIAEIYECPEGTVKSRLFYAIKELSKIYKK